MRIPTLCTFALATLLAPAAQAETPAPTPAAPAAAPAADKPAPSEVSKPKESPLPFAMYMAGAGVGGALMGGYLTFASDDAGSNRLGVPLMVAGGLAAAAGVVVVVLSSKEPAKAGRARPTRVEHRVSVGPGGAAYALRF